MGLVAHMREKRNSYIILVGNPEGNKSLRRRRHGVVYYVKLDLTEIGLEGVDWVYLVRYRDQWLTIVNAVMSHKKQGISWLVE